MAIQQSISWWCFENKGIDDAALLRKAKEIGYTGVELISKEKFDLVRDNGLIIASHGGHDSISDGLNDPAQHDRIESEIYASLELAVKYQIPNLIVFSGDRREGLTDEQGITNTAQGLRRVSAAAEQAGVTLIIELLNSKVDHHGYQCDHTAWGVEVCKLVDSPRVKLLYDIYHMQIMEGDLIRTIQTQHQYFGHYHTAGNPGRNDLDQTQEIYYPAVIRAIAETGYSGFLGQEFLPKADVVPALQAAYDVCTIK